jgi:peptide/nickel transport system substrate-binding protein
MAQVNIGKFYGRFREMQLPAPGQSPVMTPKFWLLSLILIPILLAACVRQPEPMKESSKQVQTNAQMPPLANYQTREIGGIELRQGRWAPGIHGGSLVSVVSAADPVTFNPWAAEDAFSLELCNYLFRGLADIDNLSGEIIPDMAVEITSAPDRLSYKTRLRKGLIWSDKTPITSEDVAFTWNRIIAQGYGSNFLREAALSDGKMPVCTCEDALTNKFVLSRPSLSFMRVLAALRIAPRHVLESVITKSDGRFRFRELWSANRDTSQMVTSGPFRLSTFIPGQKVEFCRSDNFYMIDRNGCRLPYLDSVVYNLVPKAGEALLAFDKREADLAQVRPRDNSWLVSQEKKENFQLYNLGPANTSFFMVFNMNRRRSLKSQQPFVDPVKSAWFNDTNFRQAVNHAVNRELIISDFFKKAGSPTFLCEPAASPFYNQSLKPFPPDLQYARALLARSGFSTKKKDGSLYDARGNRVRFKLSYAARSKLYEFAAGAIAADLSRLGMAVELEPMESGQAQGIAGSAGSKNWDAHLFSLTADPLDPNSSAAVFCSSGRLHFFDQRDPDLKGNVVVTDARPWELRLDEIYRQAAAEFDPAKRKLLYGEAQKIIYDEAPFIYLVAPDVIIAARNTLKNYAPTPLSQTCLGLHNLEEIYLAEGRSALARVPQSLPTQGLSVQPTSGQPLPGPTISNPDLTGQGTAGEGLPGQGAAQELNEKAASEVPPVHGAAGEGMPAEPTGSEGLPRDDEATEDSSGQSVPDAGAAGQAVGGGEMKESSEGKGTGKK